MVIIILNFKLNQQLVLFTQIWNPQIKFHMLLLTHELKTGGKDVKKFTENIPNEPCLCFLCN